jgi:hypothetical protein
MSTTAIDRPAFTGWYRLRPGSAWRAVCQAESEVEAWDLLGALVRESGDTVVLPSYRHPDHRRHRGRQHAADAYGGDPRGDGARDPD